MSAIQQSPITTAEDLDRAMDALDDLIEAGVELPALIDRCATIFGCRVGVDTPHGTSIAASPEKEPIAQSAPRMSHHRTLLDGTSVWMAPARDERYPAALDGDAAGPRRDRLLRRLGIAVRATTPQHDTTHSRTNDLRSVVDPSLSDQDRLAAQRRLRLAGKTVTMVALTGPDDGTRTVLDQLRARSTSLHQLLDDRVHMVLARDLATLKDLDLPEGIRCAYTPACPIEQAPEAWRKARSALRFAVPSTHATGPYPLEEAVVLNSARVGPYTILAEQLTPDQIARVADVQRLDKLYQETGPEMLHTLLAVAATESLRQAARVVHMHHNSVTYRVQRAERMLGFSCTKPYGRSRLMFVLTLHRILHSWRHF
ncbi:helix-turn-helix domain-containing protein [Nocardia miyunensis]|uniref:helix-turn-helix domain-containing protein n=1 Tax=Nocardia miyunensis TaxID=282684 RepID=UPI000A59D108|nr:helix-turn-helix domain-containing protein [Nocardia miyunensis]